MSNDSIELKQLVGDMSASGSFGHPSTGSPTFHGNMVNRLDTEVSAVPPVYQTVPDAKTAHASYQAEHIHPPGSSGPYMTPSEASAPNEYDIVQDKNKSHTHTTRYEADNVLYAEQRTGDFRHATLREKGQAKYSGTVSETVYEPDVKTWSCRIRTKDVCYFFLFMVATVIALAALALALILIVGVYTPSNLCDCEASPEEIRSLQEIFQALSQNVTELNAMVQQTQQPPEGGVTTDELNNAIDNLGEELREEIVAVEQRVNATIDDTRLGSGGLSTTVSANITIDGLYDGCTTTMLSSCPFGPADSAPGFAVCDTNIEPLNVAEHSTIDAYCAQTDEEGETNPVISTLQVFPDGTAHCLCSLVIPTTMESFITNPLRCAMFVTRCPINQTLEADIRYTHW